MGTRAGPGARSSGAWLLSILVRMLVGSETSQPREGRTSTLIDGVLSGSIGRLPLNVALLLGAAVYLGVGLALPLSTGAPRVLLVLANVLGAVLGFVVILTWLEPQVHAANRRHLLEWTTNLHLLSAQEFEWIVGEILRREGWDVQETGREGAPDGNVDLRIRRGARESLVQCKRWSSTPVGIDEVRKLAGTLMREGLPGNAGVLVTLSHFTEPAIAEAATVGIKLVDNEELVLRIEKVRASEPCPTCGTAMLLDRSSRGWWLRCPRWAEGCDGKRDLGDDPGQAVGLLLAD